MIKKLYLFTGKEKASSTNKIISAFPPCPDNLTLNNFSNNEVESVKNVIDTVRKIPFSQPSCGMYNMWYYYNL